MLIVEPLCLRYWGSRKLLRQKEVYFLRAQLYGRISNPDAFLEAKTGQLIVVCLPEICL